MVSCKASFILKTKKIHYLTVLGLDFNCSTRFIIVVEKLDIHLEIVWTFKDLPKFCYRFCYMNDIVVRMIMLDQVKYFIILRLSLPLQTTSYFTPKITDY